MIVFSCCLYGVSKRYITPLFENNLEEIESYLGEKCEFVIYCNDDVPSEHLSELIEHGYIIKNINFRTQSLGNMFIRYLPFFDTNYQNDTVLIRDTDCIYTKKELDLIKEWLVSDFSFHIIRGHPLHVYPVMGGLFGVKPSFSHRFRELVLLNSEITSRSEYNADQKFLFSSVYPEVYKDALVHSVSVVFSKENYIIYNVGDESIFIGETILDDEKRKNEKDIKIDSSKVYVFNQLWTKLFRCKGGAKLITWLSTWNRLR